MTPKISTEILNFCRHPWVKIYRFLCQYLEPGGHIGLYVHLRDTADAIHPFISRNAPSRVDFRTILVPRDPLRQLRNDCSCVISDHETVDSDGLFWLRMPFMTLENELIRCPRRGSSPRVSKSVKNWSLWTEKCPRPWWWHLLFRHLGFSRFFFKGLMVIL